MRLEIKITAEMTLEQVRAWAEAFCLHMEETGDHIVTHIRADLRDAAASPYWQIEVN